MGRGVDEGEGEMPPGIISEAVAQSGVTGRSRQEQLGFQGKLCIHPNQIEPCHAIFTPTDGEIDSARRVVGAFEAGEARGLAAIEVDGKFVDYAVVKRSRRILRLASRIAGMSIKGDV